MKVSRSLNELENLLNEVSCTGNDQQNPPAQNILLILATLRHQLVEESLLLPTEEQVGRYVRVQQSSITHVLNLVLSLSMDQALNSAVEKSLHGLLDFLQGTFPSHFNFGAAAPGSLVAKAWPEINHKLLALQKSWQGQGIEAELMSLSLHPLSEVGASASANLGTVSYHQLAYVRKLMPWLDQMPATQAGWIRWACGVNLNSREAVAFCWRQMRRRVNEKPARPDKMDAIAQLRWEVNEIQPLPHMQYHPGLAPLNEQLMSFLEVEAAHLEQMHQLALQSPPRTLTTTPGFKLKMSGSVAQLAFLLRLLVESKVITNDNLSQLLHFFVRHTITKKTETISPVSLRSKYYNIEHTTKQSVRQLLTTILHSI